MVAGHQGSKHQGRLNKMPILRQMLGRSPNGPKARVRNFIANARLGTKATTIHENVISPGVVVPWHTHATEEVIVVLSGEGECRTENGTQAYSAGDVLIFPAGVKHSIRNPGRCCCGSFVFSQPTRERSNSKRKARAKWSKSSMREKSALAHFVGSLRCSYWPQSGSSGHARGNTKN